MFPTLLVMLALDSRDPSVLDAVVAGAGPLGATRVIVAHVFARDVAPDFLGGAATDPARPAALDAAIHALRDRLPWLEVTGLHAAGNPAEELARIARAEDVDLLILGRQPAEDGESAWGPHGRSLLRSIACSALIVPRGATLAFDEAVVGLDFSHNATAALRAAAKLCGQVDALYQYDPRVVDASRQTTADFEAELGTNAQRHFTENVLPEVGAARAPTLTIVAGTEPSRTLAAHAAGRLLVVGSRGLSRLAALLLGSTAEGLAGRSEGPVLIIRAKGEALGVLEGLFHR
jgi:nucleotide-binding universal stress UspA family protein